MRRIYCLIAILTLSFALTAPGFAADEEEDPDRIVNTEMKRSHEKLKRGAINVLSSPLEIIKQTKVTVDESERIPRRIARVVPGVFRGFGYTVVRFLSGAWDVVTFNNMFYEENEPLLKPTYVWDEDEK